MTNRLLGLLFAAVLSIPAVAQKPLLPDDLLLSPTSLSDTASIQQVAENTFEITRPVPSDPSVGSAFNFSTFCIASYLAWNRGYSGWSLGMRKTEEAHPKELHYVVALLNDEDGVAALSRDLKWTEYSAYKQIRKLCVSFLKPQYLWPEK